MKKLDVIDVKGRQNGKYLDNLPIIENKSINYNDFFKNYLMKNQACLVRNAATEWEASVQWATDGKPNFTLLCEKYGTCVVTQYDCAGRYYNSQPTKESLFADYVKYWQSFNVGEVSDLWYLKDWHLRNSMAGDECFYETPMYFRSDWLNEYLCDSQADDYRFVYMGPKGSWTPFHVDVFKSYSWSANVCGRKKWILLLPGEEDKIKDRFNKMPFDITSHYQNLRHYEVYQEAGDALFVPSGWYHQVLNLDDTISINHNWVNGCNILSMYNELKDVLKTVKNEISDCSDSANYPEQCQLLLKSIFGMDVAGFVDFINHICKKRVAMFYQRDFVNMDSDHIIFDLNCVYNVMSAVLAEQTFDKTETFDTLSKVKEIIE